MTRIQTVLLLTVSVLLFSCEAEPVTPPAELVEFSTKSIFPDEGSKATPVTELPSFNVLACTGSAGAEVRAWSGVATKSGDVYATGQYWPTSDPGWIFSMSNAALTYGAAGATVSVDGSTDVVVSYMPDAEYKERNAPVFRHVLARIGTVQVNTQEGFVISGINATLLDGRSSGTYNIRTGEWSSVGAGSDVVLAASEAGADNDVWVIPGEYQLRVTYTLSREYALLPEDYSVTFTRTSTVNLAPGKINNLTADATGASAPVESVIRFSDYESTWGWTSDVNLENGVMNTAGDVSIFVLGDNVLGRNDPEYIVSEHSIVLGNKNYMAVSVPSGHDIYALRLSLTETDGTLILGIPSYADFSCTPSPNIGGSLYDGEGRNGGTTDWIADLYSWTWCDPSVNSLTFETATSGGSRRFDGMTIVYR